jgi:fermentation-respiration switch protein FrsA (DUF1100 family)
MGASKLALLAGSVAAALLAVLWWQHDGPATRAMRAAAQPDAARTAVATVESPSPGAASPTQAATPAPPRAEATGMRATDAELRARAVEESYVRIGSVFVDHLVARGLAQADGERVVRRFFEDNLRCLFDALRIEADIQSVAYDSVLDAIEADLYDTDGPLLGALLDMRAVENRVVPCALTAAQQAGIEPSALTEETRAAIIRRAR